MRCSPRARRRRSRLNGCVQGARAGQKKTGDLGARSWKARAGRRHRSIILPLIREQVVHTAKLQMRHAREPLAAQQHQTSRGTFSYKYGERAAAPLDRPSARSRGCGRSFAPLHHVPCRGGARSISVQQCTRNSLCVYNVVLPLLLRWLSCCSCCVGCVFSGTVGVVASHLWHSRGDDLDCAKRAVSCFVCANVCERQLHHSVWQASRSSMMSMNL